MHSFMAALRANRFAVTIASVWLVLLWGLVAAGSMLYGEPFLLTAWAGSWDGAWYKSIVEQGYYTGVIDHQVNVAFFPLYPLLVWLVGKITLLPTVWAGMAVSSLSFAAALVVLWQFVHKFFDRRIARWTLLLVAFNPWALYFGMMYTESLFMLLAAGTFWFLYRKQWWPAAALAGLATATRSVGIALAISVIASWLWHHLAKPDKVGRQTMGTLKRIFAVSRLKIFFGESSDRTPSLTKGEPGGRTPVIFFGVPIRTHAILFILGGLGLVALSFSGLILFSFYLWQHTGDPFAYRTAQTHWPGRGGLTNVGHELVYLWQHKVVNMEYLITAMWYAAGVIAFVGLWLVMRMRQWLMALYTGIALSLPILFGTAASMNRYMQVTFPIFIAYGAAVEHLPRWGRWALLAACVIGLGIITILMVDPRDFFMA